MSDIVQVDIDWVRDWIGNATPPTDDDLDTVWQVLPSREGIAWRVLSRRYADMVNTPSSVTIPGTLSVSTGANLAALKARLDRLLPLVQAAGVDVGGVVGVTNMRLWRCGVDLGRVDSILDGLNRASELGGYVGPIHQRMSELGRQLDRGGWDPQGAGT